MEPGGDDSARLLTKESFVHLSIAKSDDTTPPDEPGEQIELP